jgi:antitoxin component of MazEF toxin-antitoxin module
MSNEITFKKAIAKMGKSLVITIPKPLMAMFSAGDIVKVTLVSKVQPVDINQGVE